MKKAVFLGAVVGAIGLGMVATSAVAAPIGGVALEKEAATLVEKAHGCCRRYYGYYGYRPYYAYGFRPYYGYRPYYRYGYYRPYRAFIGFGFGPRWRW
jgi:hypothetical protein